MVSKIETIRKSQGSESVPVSDRPSESPVPEAYSSASCLLFTILYERLWQKIMYRLFLFLFYLYYSESQAPDVRLPAPGP